MYSCSASLLNSVVVQSLQVDMVISILYTLLNVSTSNLRRGRLRNLQTISTMSSMPVSLMAKSTLLEGEFHSYFKCEEFNNASLCS